MPFLRQRNLLAIRWMMIAGAVLGITGKASAQDLFVGPIQVDFTLTDNLIYTTNVDQVPDDQEAAEDPEDFYMRYGIRLAGRGRMNPDIDLNLGLSINREKHFIRTDLDDDGEAPLYGDASFDFSRARGHYTYGLGLSHRVTRDWEDQEIFVSGERRTANETRTISRGDVNLGWSRGPVSLNTRGQYTQERYSEGFEDGETDRTNLSANLDYQIHSRITARGTYHRTKEVLINNSNAYAGWEETINANLQFQLLTRPTLTYQVGFEKEDDGEEDGKWEPRHVVQFQDSRNLAPALSYRLFSTYNFEEEEEEDDIEFTYGASLIHSMPHRFEQTLTARREPVDTFGSTTDSDQTTLTYILSQPSFLIREMSMNFNVTYMETIPKGPNGDGPTEESLEYRLNLSRSIQIMPKLTSTLQYIYSLEQSNIIGDIEEHRLNLQFSYQVF